MRVGRHLVHRCDTQRYSEVTQGYGSQRTPTDHLYSLHCRFKTDVQRGFNSVSGHWVVSTGYKLMVEFDADVVAGDRVTNVLDERGQAIPGNYEVAGAMERRGQAMRHKTLVLNKVA